MCFSILYSILALCNLECRSEENGYPDYSSKSLEYIHKNYYNPDLSITEISKAVSTNESYLRKAFSEYLDISPKHYIDKLRIKKPPRCLKAAIIPFVKRHIHVALPTKNIFQLFLKSILTNLRRHIYIIGITQVK